MVVLKIFWLFWIIFNSARGAPSEQPSENSTRSLDKSKIPNMINHVFPFKEDTYTTNDNANSQILGNADTDKDQILDYHDLSLLGLIKSSRNNQTFLRDLIKPNNEDGSGNGDAEEVDDNNNAYPTVEGSGREDDYHFNPTSTDYYDELESEESTVSVWDENSQNLPITTVEDIFNTSNIEYDKNKNNLTHQDNDIIHRWLKEKEEESQSNNLSENINFFGKSYSLHDLMNLLFKNSSDSNDEHGMNENETFIFNKDGIIVNQSSSLIKAFLYLVNGLLLDSKPKDLNIQIEKVLSVDGMASMVNKTILDFLHSTNKTEMKKEIQNSLSIIQEILNTEGKENNSNDHNEEDHELFVNNESEAEDDKFNDSVTASNNRSSNSELLAGNANNLRDTTSQLFSGLFDFSKNYTSFKDINYFINLILSSSPPKDKNTTLSNNDILNKTLSPDSNLPTINSNFTDELLVNTNSKNNFVSEPIPVHKAEITEINLTTIIPITEDLIDDSITEMSNFNSEEDKEPIEEQIEEVDAPKLSFIQTNINEDSSLLKLNNPYFCGYFCLNSSICMSLNTSMALFVNNTGIQLPKEATITSIWTSRYKNAEIAMDWADLNNDINYLSVIVRLQCEDNRCFLDGIKIKINTRENSEMNAEEVIVERNNLRLFDMEIGDTCKNNSKFILEFENGIELCLSEITVSTYENETDSINLTEESPPFINYNIELFVGALAGVILVVGAVLLVRRVWKKTQSFKLSLK